MDHLALSYIMKQLLQEWKDCYKFLVLTHLTSTIWKEIYDIKFYYRIKLDESNTHDIIHISLDLQEVLQEICYIHTGSAGQKAGITVGKIHRHDKVLLHHLKPEKSAKMSVI